ncbi:C40 family peptidase [Streptomyces phytophilus]|uniref:C40 family peptidase n=1 Tax=Streptomyces phytophilus TaxID=722715 RepID=UPI00215D6DE2|nr:C40 family peptidase [Streptomyces phytophilus]
MPYLWGGDGPAAGEDGFDCSGLTRAVCQAAGITISRVAHDQFNAGPRIPTDELKPGDLVFYGTPTNIHHVGIYVGQGQMINAPRPGSLIEIAPCRYSGDDYAGATRPSEQDSVVSERRCRCPGDLSSTCDLPLLTRQRTCRIRAASRPERRCSFVRGVRHHSVRLSL